MDKRRKDLSDLKTYIQNADKEVTMILRNFFWDQKHIVEKPPLIGCRYNPHHKISVETKSEHEDKCYLTRHGYTIDEPLLPDPVYTNTNTLVKYSKEEIRNIIHAVAKFDSSFQTGKGCQGPEPLSVDRLQQTYTADERRAIYNAVVQAAPSCHNLADLALGSGTNTDGKKTKTRLEVLAELRDMRRRRVKYRVASKTSNYSNVLRDVIKTQMDLYAESHGVFIKTEYGAKTFVSLCDKESISRINKTSQTFFIKQERVTPEPGEVIDTESSRRRQHDYERHERDTERQHDRERHDRDRDRYNRENRRYDSNRRHSTNRSRSRDKDRSTPRYRDERDDRSTGYRGVKREIKSENPKVYRNENSDSAMSSYENRHRRFDERFRYDDGRRNEYSYIRESRIKSENDTQIILIDEHAIKTEPVEVNQENMDNYEVNSENTVTYGYVDDGVKSQMDSQEHLYKHRGRDQGRDKYRNRDEERYRREHRDDNGNRQRNNNRDESRQRNRDEDGNRNDDRRKIYVRRRDDNRDFYYRHRSEDRDGDRQRYIDKEGRRHKHRDTYDGTQQRENYDKEDNRGRDNRKDKSEHRHKDIDRDEDRSRHEQKARHRREWDSDRHTRTGRYDSSSSNTTRNKDKRNSDNCYDDHDDISQL